MDVNGEKPEIYMCTTNRTGGKTTFFNRYVVNRWMNYREKFMLVYRYNYELDNVAQKFFNDIEGLFFEGWRMRSERAAQGSYHILFLIHPKAPDDDKGIPCGYAVTLNAADSIKKNSHLFYDTQRMLFDEFQSETNHYCSNEVQKFLSIHTSVARGGGKHTRYVPVIMIANPVSLLNPYYAEMGISERLHSDTRFLRGDGFVLEQGYIDEAATAQKQSAFNRAFAKNSYTSYAAEGLYLNDNKAFIEKPKGRGRYICTLRYKGNDYAIREFLDNGIVYCDDKADSSCPNRLAVTTDDHNINYVMLKRNELFLTELRYYFTQGCFRFRNLSCKEAVMKALAF